MDKQRRLNPVPFWTNLEVLYFEQEVVINLTNIYNLLKVSAYNPNAANRTAVPFDLTPSCSSGFGAIACEVLTTKLTIIGDVANTCGSLVDALSY